MVVLQEKSSERKLIVFEKGKRCLLPMSYTFWSKDIPLDCIVQTQSSTKKRHLVKRPFKVVK